MLQGIFGTGDGSATEMMEEFELLNSCEVDNRRGIAYDDHSCPNLRRCRIVTHTPLQRSSTIPRIASLNA